jgi:hypothetical protein
MFSLLISEWWFTPNPDSREYHLAEIHVANLLETLKVSLPGIKTPEHISDMVDELAKGFLERFDTSPSDPGIKFNPFLMAENCADILTKETQHPIGLDIEVKLRNKVANLLRSYGHISLTAKFTSELLDEQRIRDVAFAMISHERLGNGQSVAQSLDSDIIKKLCNDAKLVSSQEEQRRLISDGTGMRRKYIEFVFSQYESYMKIDSHTYAWTIFRNSFIGTMYQ